MDSKTLNYLLVLNGGFLGLAWALELWHPKIIFAWFDLRLLSILYLLLVIYVILKNKK
jgi:hypothetical protein